MNFILKTGFDIRAETKRRNMAISWLAKQIGWTENDLRVIIRKNVLLDNEMLKKLDTAFQLYDSRRQAEQVA